MLSIPGIKDFIKTREGRKSHGAEFECFFGSGDHDPLDISSYLVYLAKRLNISLLALLEVGDSGKSARVRAAGSTGSTCELTMPRLDGDGALAGLIAKGELAAGRARVFSKDEVFPASGSWCDLIPMDSTVTYVFVPVAGLPLPEIARGTTWQGQHLFILATEDPGTEGEPALPLKVTLAAGLLGFSLALLEWRRDRQVLKVLRDILKQEGYSIGFTDDSGTLISKDGKGFDRLAPGLADRLRRELACMEGAPSGGEDSHKNLTPEDAEDIRVVAYPVMTPETAPGHVVAVKECNIASQIRTRGEKLTLLSRFMSSIAHEVKNPLTGIAAGVQYLARKIQPGLKEDETVEFILSEINRLNRIVDDLYKIARPPELVFQQVGLNDIVGRSLICLSEDITRKRLTVEQNMDSDMPQFEADPDRLQQIFINIIKNAIEASPEGGALQIETCRRDSRAVIRVTDNGRGISHEEKEKIFEPFYSTKERGSGLGLCISQRIVDEHGGSIRVETPEQGGTAFIIELPIRR